MNNCINLPVNWQESSIEKIIGDNGIFIDGDWIESKDQDPTGDIRLIQLADIGDGNFRNKSNRFLTLQKAKELNCTFLNLGDVLLARMPDPLGRACLFPGDSKRCVTAVDVCIIRPGCDSVSNRWLMYAINSSAFRAEIEKQQSGSTRKRISRSNLAKLFLPIPPLKEQNRIVGKVEELFTKLDAGVASLEKVRAQLKRYRQAALKAAFSGQLTVEWRQTNSGVGAGLSCPNESKISDVHKGANTAPFGGQTNQIRQDRRMICAALQNGNLPDLPAGWEWIKLEDISEEIEKINPRLKPNLEFFYLDIASINNTVQKVTEPKKYIGGNAPSRARQLIKSDDILFSTVRTYLKNIALVDSKYDGQIASTGFCIIRIKEPHNKKYYFHLVQTNLFLNPLTEMQRGTSYPAVRDSDVFAQIVPLPSPDEQNRIVSEIERRFSVADEVEKTVENALKQARRLRQSILKRAFEGKLVPQDPNDEPAEKLLERIRAEKAKMAETKKMRKKK